METNAFSGAITTTGAALPAVDSQGVAVVGSLIYIFGGSQTGGITGTSDMHTFNPDPTSYAVTQITQSGDVPSARLAMSFLTYGSKIVLFGGYTGSATSDLRLFDSATSTWSTPTTTGTTPDGRSIHAAAIYDSTMCIHGGLSASSTLYDFHCLDLQTWVWSQIPFTS